MVANMSSVSRGNYMSGVRLSCYCNSLNYIPVAGFDPYLNLYHFIPNTLEEQQCPCCDFLALLSIWKSLEGCCALPAVPDCFLPLFLPFIYCIKSHKQDIIVTNTAWCFYESGVAELIHCKVIDTWHWNLITADHSLLIVIP